MEGAPIAVLVKAPDGRPLVDGVALLAGDSALAFAAAACDFLRCAAGLDK